MAGEGESKSAGRFESSVFYPHIETNTRVKPHVYYNLGVYVTLYNRIRGDLQNNFDGDLSTFDTVINEKIKEGLTGSKAEVEAFLDQYGYKGMIKLYDDGVVNSETKGKIKKDDYDYMVSNHNILDEFDKTIALARELTRVKYGGQENKRAMLTYDDAREIMHIKEEKSDKTFYELSRSMTSNAGGFDSKGKKFGGVLNQAMRTAEDKERGFRKNRRIGFWKAVGWGALTVGAAALTIGLGFGTLGLGGQALGSLFGTLYTTTGVAGAVGGVLGTGLAGYGTVSWFGRFLGRTSANFKLRRKHRDFLYSRGKYAEADYNEFDKMGYKRLKMLYDEHVALKKFYDNYSKGVLVTKRRGKPEAIDYVPREYRRAFLRYLEREGIAGANARTADTLMSNAKHHRFVANQDLKEGEFGYYNLYRFMNRGVEGYETSKLTPDEVILNYGTEVTSGTGAKPRLHKDVIREHKGYPDELSYLTAKLNEFVAYEDTFKSGSQMGEFAKGLERFVSAYNTSFAGSLFESPYTSKIIGNADNIMKSSQFTKMIEVTNAGTVKEHLQSVVDFLAAERDNNQRSVKVLSEKAGVGVEYQLDMSEESLKKGCKSVGDNSPEAEAAAAALAAMTTCSIEFASDGKTVRRVADPAVIAAINAVSSDKTKKYLNHILESKLISTKISADTYTATLAGTEKTVAEGFTTRIYAMGSSADAVKIRTDIAASTSIPKEIKDKLNAILEEQIMGLETKIRDDARVNAIKGIKKGSSKFSELVKAIDEIKSFKKEELHDLWIKIQKVDDPNLYDYLVLRFKDKVTHELMEYATNTAKFGGENIESKLKAIKDFMLDASALCPASGEKFIDKWQLQECIGALSMQVGITLSAYLDDLEKTFLTDTNTKKEALTRLITQPIPVGLKEYFDTKTPESEAILERARRFTLSADVYSFMTVSSIGGYTGLIDADSADSKAALNIYFRQNRAAGDPLLKLLQRLNADVKSTNINSRDPDIISALPQLDTSGTDTVVIDGDNIELPRYVGASGGVYNCERIIADRSSGSANYNLPVPAGEMKTSFLYSTIETLKSADFTSASAAERLATLAILKKKITAMIRVQMIKLYEQKRGSATTYPDFVLNHRTDLVSRLITNWEKVAEVIDNLIVNAKNHLSSEDLELYSSVSANTVDAIRAICNVDEYQRKIGETKVFGA